MTPEKVLLLEKESWLRCNLPGAHAYACRFRWKMGINPAHEILKNATQSAPLSWIVRCRNKGCGRRSDRVWLLTRWDIASASIAGNMVAAGMSPKYRVLRYFGRYVVGQFVPLATLR